MLNIASMKNMWWLGDGKHGMGLPTLLHGEKVMMGHWKSCRGCSHPHVLPTWGRFVKIATPRKQCFEVGKILLQYWGVFDRKRGHYIQVFRLLSIPHPPNWTRNHRHVWDDSPIPTIIKGDFSLWGRYIQYMITRVSWLNGYSYKNGSNHYSHCGYYSSL